ncbi:hypothetical protein Tco_0604509 [Tanacetum coccineum]
MAASLSSYLSDSSDESVDTSPSRLLFGDIPLRAPVVETTLVASPTGLCGLFPYTVPNPDTPDEVSSRGAHFPR